MHKTPDDLARYELLIDRLHPEVIVETGLYYGGSHIWFAERVPHVISVEHNEETTAGFLRNEWGLGEPPDNGSVILGDSIARFGDVEHLARRLAGDGPILVILDSDHGTEHVWNEIVRYHTLVTCGSYLVVEDGILHHIGPGPFKEGNWFDGDPLIAIERFLDAQPDQWDVDLELEDMFPTTQHPSGWLRRRC